MPAIPAQPVKFQNVTRDGETPSPESLFRREGLGRAGNVEEQAAAVAREVVVRRQIAVVARAPVRVNDFRRPSSTSTWRFRYTVPSEIRGMARRTAS